MVRSFEYEFRSDRDILDIQELWQSLGPYKWGASDNDQYGIYIVARDPTTRLRIKVSGDKPDYTLETDFDVPPNQVEQMKQALFKEIFEKLLPAAGATHVRDSGGDVRTSGGAPPR